MGFFGSNRSTSPINVPTSRGTASGTPKPDTVQLPDPGLDPEDPAQILHGLLKACGLSFVIIAPQPIEHLLPVVLESVTTLAESEIRGKGLLQLTSQPLVFWWAIDGPHGSSVVVAVGPENDGGFIAQEVAGKINNLPAPVEWAVCTLGSLRADFVPYITGGNVVPVTDFPQLKGIGTPDGYDLLPIYFRRAAANWNMLASTLYAKSFSTPRQDNVMVFGGLRETPSFPEIMVRVDVEFPEQAQRIQSLIADSQYSLSSLEDFLVFGRAIDQPVTAEQLGQLAQQLVTDWWRTVGAVLGWAPPGPPSMVVPTEVTPTRAAKSIEPPQDRMTPALSKGQNISLAVGRSDLTSVRIGLGWRTISGRAPVDLDASALAIGPDRRVLSDNHFVFFNNLKSPDGSIRHGGDNLVGNDGDVRDCEQIFVQLDEVPSGIHCIVFAVSVYDAEVRGQSFASVNNAYIRVVDNRTDFEIARYSLTCESGSETAMLFGEMYRRGSLWKFRAIGQGYASGLAGIAGDFGVDA